MQSLDLWKKMLMWIFIIPFVPFVCLIYIISPNSKVSHAERTAARLGGVGEGDGRVQWVADQVKDLIPIKDESHSSSIVCSLYRR